MTVAKRLRHLAEFLTKDNNSTTTMLAKVVTETHGLLLCENFEMAKIAKHKFQIATESIEKNLEGYAAPIYIDNYAVAEMFVKAARKIEALEEELKMANDKIGDPNHV